MRIVSDRVTGIYSIGDLQSGALIRVTSLAISASLLAASLAIIVDAQVLPKPLMQIPAVLITVLFSLVIFWASHLFLGGHHRVALSIWASTLALLILVTLLQVLPFKYETMFLLKLKDFSPPPWPYCIAIPLLFFLLLDIYLPQHQVNKTSLVFVIVGLTSAIAFLFFSYALLGSVANLATTPTGALLGSGSGTSLILNPSRMFISFLIPIAISAILILGTTLPRKGFAIQGILLMIVTGLGLEWVSTWSYDGPSFISESSWFPFPGFPMLALLSGTIPGAGVALAGIIGIWNVYVENNISDEAI